MSVSLKAFIIDDDDTVHRITYAMYKHLVAQEPEACLCQYADCRVRYALIAVDMKDRKPKDILHTEEGFFTFDSSGRLDLSSKKEEIKLVFDNLKPHENNKFPKQIVDAKHLFAKKKYEDKFTWKHTPQILKAGSIEIS